MTISQTKIQVILDNHQTRAKARRARSVKIIASIVAIYLGYSGIIAVLGV